MRAGDPVARFGGDGFVVVAEAQCDEEGAAQPAERSGEALTRAS
ncbi:nucleotidyl cyclase domain-containing protein [Blastococcus deserti]|uniref:GGDEF domain-containing protein n=1 Tax=Blastococcus deserti TaxID=2259033 RepID=A0ABW4XDQ7_9ACTN